MKKYILICMCFCGAMNYSNIQAQEDTLTFRKTEFGFNAVPFISNLLPFGDPVVASESEVLLIYKGRLSANNVFLRTGMQFNFTSEESSSEDILLNFRLGLEKKKLVSKRWVIHSGGELFTSLISPEIGELDRSEFGIAGLLGFQWLINDRMGLGTEGYITLSYIQDKRSISGDVEGISSGFTVPQSLFFSVYF